MFPMLFLMGGNPANGAAPNPLVSFLPFIFIIAVMYFMMIRPQQKKQKEHQKMISALGKGDKIITVGGIYGTVQGTTEKTLHVKIADNVKIEMDRSGVATVLQSSAPAEESKTA